MSNESEMPENGGENLEEHVAPSVKSKSENTAKYEKIWAIGKERPGEFSEMELCRKHGVKYGNYQSWKRARKLKVVSTPRFVPTTPPAFTMQSVVVTTVEDLTTAITALVREGVKNAIHDGIKSGKIKVVR